jgi:glycosyltransferase involved in cell wall biosynthesis
MKIVYLADSAIPSRTANSVHVMKMCQALSSLGHTVRMITPDFVNDTDNKIRDLFAYYGVRPVFEIIKVPCLFIIRKKIVNLFKAGKFIKEFKPDLAYGRSIQACFLASLLGIPTVFESHGRIWKNGLPASLLFRILIRRKAFHGLVVISDALKKIYLLKKLLTKDNIFVAHDGADDQESAEPLTSWPGRAGILQVGYIGHLFEGRGIEIIVTLAKQFDMADFHFIGGTETDITRWRVKNLPANVYFHGHVPPGEVARYRAMCDVLVAPYQKRVMVFGGRDETAQFMSPLKIFEYMASRKAIICSDIPVLKEVLNERNALLVDPEDVTAWKNSLTMLLNRNIREKFANQAYADFCQQYSWQKRAERILAWVEKGICKCEKNKFHQTAVCQ